VEVLKKILSDNPSEVTPEKKAQTPFERLSQNTNPRMKEKKGSYGLIIMCGTRRGN
jgi:ribosomal protein L17